MITEIGIIAGEIWHFLDKNGIVGLDTLIGGVDRSKDLILMSLGWLAREGHVLVECQNDTYRVSLREKDADLAKEEEK
tara:strand:- start:1022 stop:1255 length:234 start_codon:yes stop_codon:yes gene_type:complete